MSDSEVLHVNQSERLFYDYVYYENVIIRGFYFHGIPYFSLGNQSTGLFI